MEYSDARLAAEKQGSGSRRRKSWFRTRGKSRQNEAPEWRVDGAAEEVDEEGEVAGVDGAGRETFLKKRVPRRSLRERWRLGIFHVSRTTLVNGRRNR